jgi:hypothetical protein
MERTRIHRYWYTITWYEGYVALSPVGMGSMATSLIEKDSYAYTHGGSTYQAAVDKAHALWREAEAKSAGA